MRKVVLSMTMTCDGFFCGPNGELDWMSQIPDMDLIDDIVAKFNESDAGFMGYPTASGMYPYWSSVENNPSSSEEELAIARAVNSLHGYIITKKDEQFEWKNAELLVIKSDQELVEAVNRIKQQPGNDLGVPGGIRTAQTFVRLGLIDEYVLTVHPVAIGKGQSIFTNRVNLDLISAKTYKSGVIRVFYLPGSRA